MDYINRALPERIMQGINNNPVTAIIGARQVGKSTLAKMLMKQYDKSLYIDLEKPSDRVLLTDAESFFYRTAKGDEIDLLLVKGRKKIAIEIKASSSPTLTKGFWQAINDLEPDEAYVIAPVRQAFPLNEVVWAYTLDDFLNK